MYWFSIGGDDSQIVSLDGQLSWADAGETVDHSEPVSAAWGDGEHFQWGVSHETSVRISELSFTVDQHAFGILTC